MTRAGNPEHNFHKLQSLGSAVGNILLWGTEQYSRYSEMRKPSSGSIVYWARSAQRGGMPFHTWYDTALERQKTKLEWREFDVKRLLSLGLVLNVMDANHSSIITGRLKEVNLADASMMITNPNRSLTITYAETLSVPEEIRQRYLGHTLTVHIAVLSINNGEEVCLDFAR